MPWTPWRQQAAPCCPQPRCTSWLQASPKGCNGSATSPESLRLWDAVGEAERFCVGRSWTSLAASRNRGPGCLPHTPCPAHPRREHPLQGREHAWLGWSETRSAVQWMCSPPASSLGCWLNGACSLTSEFIAIEIFPLLSSAMAGSVLLSGDQLCMHRTRQCRHVCPRPTGTSPGVLLGAKAAPQKGKLSPTAVQRAQVPDGFVQGPRHLPGYVDS